MAPVFPTLEEKLAAEIAAQPDWPVQLDPSVSDTAFKDALSLLFWLHKQCEGGTDRAIAAIDGASALLNEAHYAEHPECRPEQEERTRE